MNNRSAKIIVRVIAIVLVALMVLSGVPAVIPVLFG